MHKLNLTKTRVLNELYAINSIFQVSNFRNENENDVS